MFTIGSTVKNKLNNKVGTVTHILHDGMIRVRFDGETSTVPLHHSRFESHTVDLNDKPTPKDPQTFERGDFIRVTDSDLVSVRGAALTDIGTFGYSTFDMLTEDGQYLGFNANSVSVEVLFRADIARGQMPKY